MTSPQFPQQYKPPSGAEDFTAQADQIRAERAELNQEIEQAELRRAQRPMTSPPQYTEPHGGVVPAGAVIDPAGQEFEKDANGWALEDGDGNPIPVGEYERGADGIALLDGELNPIPPGDWERDDETGVVLRNDAGFPYPKWPHETIEYKGLSIQIRTATPEALNALSLGSSEDLPFETRNRVSMEFVNDHISQLSRVRIIDALKAGTFSMDDYAEVMKRISRRGSARPTRQSKR
ncbi:hypothetical protein [Nocardia carnea]|uniref:hypothetical protein n=1 Tax=Nocardia carnea TaxID=37328 RepID=UPI002454C7B6|nr:hypothetical protein [Nocardia carnea]